MTTAAEAITGAKFAPAQIYALRVGNVTQYGATAAGSAQGDALAITSGACCVVVTTAAASTGVRLPATRTDGDVIKVVNQGANALNVYPATGDRINGGTANAAVVVPAAGGNRTFVFRGKDATPTWEG
jgi:hypothetical protein